MPSEKIPEKIQLILREARKLLATRYIALVAFSSATATSLNFKWLRLTGLRAPLHTWSGIYFGDRAGGSLYALHGAEVGRFYGDEVYGPMGAYLGEMREGRLVTHHAKKSRRIRAFFPQHETRSSNETNLPDRVFPVGYEDFPGPDEFQAPCDIREEDRSQCLIRIPSEAKV